MPSKPDLDTMHRAWRTHGYLGNGRDLVTKGSLVAAWTEQWVSRPDAPVLSDDGSGVWQTAGDLHVRTAELTRRLLASGVQRGDRVLMSCPPSADLVRAHIAVLRSGAIAVPVNTVYTASEVEAVAVRARPTLAILDDPARLPGVASTDVRCSSLSHPNPDSELPAMPQTGDPALLMFTSGTTGTPKGVVLTHGNVLASAEALRIAWRWTAADRLVLSLPLFHMHGLGVGVHGTLLAGGSMVIVPKFDADIVFDAIAREHATMLFGVPTMWVRIADHDRVNELASLRLCVSGSAALAPDVFDALVAKGSQRIVERYGMTETVMNISNPFDGDRRPGSVGLPLPGVEMKLSLSGEILLRGPNVFERYWESDLKVRDEEGFFETGDLATIDDDGYVRIVGRSKDLIISGGFNVYPREVEEVLRLLPGVGDVAVAGIADPEWGEIVGAWIERRPNTMDDPLTEETVRSHATEHLAKYKRPRRVTFVEALPRNALGKVVKSELPR